MQKHNVIFFDRICIQRYDLKTKVKLLLESKFTKKNMDINLFSL